MRYWVRWRKDTFKVGFTIGWSKRFWDAHGFVAMIHIGPLFVGMDFDSRRLDLTGFKEK